MNEIELLRELRAGLPPVRAEARAQARGRLVAGFEVPAPQPARTRRRFAGPSGRLRLAAAAAFAAVLVAVVVALGVTGGGSRVEPAAAAVLRQTANVAAEATGPTGIPGPGQFLYLKVKRSELQEWSPGGFTGTAGGMIPDTSTPQGRALAREQREGFTAVVPWQEEEWANTHEENRTRWVLETPRFLSAAEQSRWEKAGSPPPSLYDGKVEARDFPGEQIDETRPGVLDVEGKSGAGFSDFSALPTAPKALRQAIEQRQGAGSPNYGGADAKPVDDGQVIAELWDILDKPNGTPALRAAVFGALAEEPGIELNRDATDLAGRPGYALSYETPKGSHSEYQLPGFGVEYIFDPATSETLGKREFVADPAQLPWTTPPPAGTTIRAVADLQSGIVDSTHERPAVAAASSRR
jgi:hypothetical protein